MGFKELGVACDFVCYTKHPFDYPETISNPRLILASTRLAKITQGYSKFNPLKILLSTLSKSVAALWIFYAIFRYDVFIFGFGRSLLPLNLDLPILAMMGKKTIMNFAHGSDARAPYVNGAYQQQDGQEQLQADFLKTQTQRIVRRYRRVEKGVSLVIGAPYSNSTFALKKYVNIFSIGIPCVARELMAGNVDPRVASVNANQASTRMHAPVRILHSPSNPASKGTVYIRRAVENLQKRGYSIDFHEITNRPNHEVLLEIQECDFVVDQIYSDSPMAAFASEAASYGKPAVVGGYGLEPLKDHIPAHMLPPSLTCMPDEVESAIAEMIDNVELRLDLGERARSFVRLQFSPTSVASRFMDILHDQIPDEWWVDPLSIEYLHGFGQSDITTQGNIRRLISVYGIHALKLGHRPKLESAFKSFADSETLR
ncbi:MAG: hypothetical protein V7696_19245 [Halioglobus sp.]